MTLSPAVLVRFAGDHGLIDRTAALDEFAVHRNLFSWTDAQALADRHKIQHNFFVGSVGVNASRHFWREIEERAYGAAGLFPRAQFENLSKQNKDGDHRRRLEID
ncbi:MAG: hypothetical protein FD172_787 [Methylocystaceae bacterium]|nr:MAG: hypothetical protein FD172_787 [Methylocystaceae bacterium]